MNELTLDTVSRFQDGLPGPLRNAVVSVRQYLPQRSFITFHYLYFLTTCFVTSLIFWGASTPARWVKYTDSLYFCISAMTGAGLNTVNLSELNTFQQIVLFFLIMIGSPIFVSIAVLHVRKNAFERKLEGLVEERNRRRSILRRTLTMPLSFSISRHKATSVQTQEGEGVLRGRKIKPHEEAAHEHDIEHFGRPSNDRTMRSNSDLTTRQINGSPPPPLPPLNTSLGRDDTEHANGSQDKAPGAEQSMSPPAGHVRFGDDFRSRDFKPYRTPTTRSRSRSGSRIFSMAGVGARPDLMNDPRETEPPVIPEEEIHHEKATYSHSGLMKTNKYIQSLNGIVGRNSAFHNLTIAERERLGGLEYQAVTILSLIVPLYFILWQLLGAIGMGCWIQINRPNMTRENGLNPFWTGAFFAISAFNNSGMALLDANAVALQTSIYSLLTLSLLILAGNTCFPPFLRLILWTIKNLVPRSERWDEKRKVLNFILDHPRRVYTNLFPSAQTWWLVFSLILLNGVDWVSFEILNIGNPTTNTIPPRFRVLDGLFQAFAVRSGGFYVVNISGLRSGLLTLYVLMMYVSAFPVTLTIRNTNIYEERSLGIYTEDSSPSDRSLNAQGEPPSSKAATVFGALKRTFTTPPSQPNRPEQGRGYFVRQQLRGQLAHDLWWIALAVLFITITETGQFERNPVVFSTFNIIFETISAYGCVGISTGVPWAAYSFSGAWHVLSKLILCAVMIRGRHRGLPVAIDKAVMLPSKSLAWAEEEDAAMRKQEGGRLNRISTGQKMQPDGVRNGRSGEREVEVQQMV